MIRTVWLGLGLLVFVIGLASFKLAVGSPRPMASAPASTVMANRDLPEINPGPEALSKSDRLPLAYISSAEPPSTELKMPSQPTSVAAPKIVSPHGPGPSTPKAAQTGTKKFKSRVSKKTCAGSRTQTVRPGGLQPASAALRPGCHLQELIEAKQRQ